MAAFVLRTVDVATIVVKVWPVSVAIQQQAFRNSESVCHRGCREWPVVLLDLEPRPDLTPPGRPRRRVRCWNLIFSACGWGQLAAAITVELRSHRPRSDAKHRGSACHVQIVTDHSPVFYIQHQFL